MFKKKKPSLDGYSSRPEIRDSKLRTDHRILPIWTTKEKIDKKIWAEIQGLWDNTKDAIFISSEF